MLGLDEFLTTMVQGIALGLGVGTGTAISYFATKPCLATLEKVVRKLREG